MIHFLTQLIFFIVSIVLMPIVEFVTFILVVCKYRKGALNYFDDVGYKFDVLSAGRNRTLWNVLFIRHGGYEFKKGTDKTISRVLGINEWLNQLTPVGWAMVYILWAIDYKQWFNGGHCFQSMKIEDFYVPDAVEFLDGTIIYKNHGR